MSKAYPWLAAALVVVLSLAAMHLMAADPKPAPGADGFVSLFDGKTLDGWDGNPDFWSVQDGCIVGQTTKEKPTKGNTFLVWAGGEPADFELRVTWKMVNHNSGIQYRSKRASDKEGDPGRWVMRGYQADIDEANSYTGIVYEEGGRGILVNRGTKITIDEAGKKTVDAKTDEKEIVSAIKKGDWNQYVIICKGNHVIQKINGVTTAEFTDNQKDKAALKGVIGFQVHAGPAMKMMFKDVKLKKLE